MTRAYAWVAASALVAASSASAFTACSTCPRPPVVTPLRKFQGSSSRSPATCRHGQLRTNHGGGLAPLRAVEAATEEDGGGGGGLDTALRFGVLLSVPLVWGTYAPAVRYIYEQPIPIPGLVFSAIYYVIALASLTTISFAAAAAGGGSQVDGGASASDEEVVARADAAGATSEAVRWLAGAELGGYLFLGNCAQVLGLQWTTADRAAFLVQLTTIIVPVLEAGVQRTSLPTRTWAACGLATVGVAVLSSDGLTGAADLRGDALIVLSAFFYSFHVLRLGKWAPQTVAIDLAVSKAAWETLYSIASVVLLVVLAGGGAAGLGPMLSGGADGGVQTVLDAAATSSFAPAADVASFFNSAARGDVTSAETAAIFTAALWCGTMTCAYTIWAQSFGQKVVRPAQANLVYTTQPIFSAIFAAALLSETLSGQGYLGGAIIGAALLISTGGGDGEATGGGGEDAA